MHRILTSLIFAFLSLSQLCSQSDRKDIKTTEKIETYKTYDGITGLLFISETGRDTILQQNGWNFIIKDFVINKSRDRITIYLIKKLGDWMSFSYLQNFYFIDNKWQLKSKIENNVLKFSELQLEDLSYINALPPNYDQMPKYSEYKFENEDIFTRKVTQKGEKTWTEKFYINVFFEILTSKEH